MKLLLVSDSHGYENIIDYTNVDNFDYTFHLGDSELSNFSCYDFFVRGNCDFAEYKNDDVVKIGAYRIFLTHGHLYDVNDGNKKIVQYAKEIQCNLVFHGHTHVVKAEVTDGVLVINPGSIMSSRSNYKETFMVVEILDNINIYIHDAKNFKLIEKKVIFSEEIFNYIK